MAVLIWIVGSATIARNSHSGLISGVLGLVALWTITQALQLLLAEVFRGYHIIRLATLFGGVLSNILCCILFSFLLWSKGRSSLNQVLTLSVLSTAVNMLFSGAVLWKIVRVPIECQRLAEYPKIGELLSVAFPLWITTIALFMVNQIDLWVMGAFRPASEVASYGAAARLVALVSMPLLVINAVAPPIIAEFYTLGRKRELEAMLRKTATLAGIPAFAALLVLIFFGGYVLQLVYGAHYRGGDAVIAILSVGQLFSVWAGSSGITLMMTGHQTAMMKITLLSGVLTLVLSIVMVFTYGQIGVAAAIAIGTVTQKIISLLAVKSFTGMWTQVKLL